MQPRLRAPNRLAMFRSRSHGYLVIELVVVFAVSAVLMLGYLDYSKGQKQAARLERTATEMESILQASVDYRWRNGAWPATFSSLNLPSGFTANPWGNVYQISGVGKTATCTTTIPTNKDVPYYKLPFKFTVTASGQLTATASLEGGSWQAASYEKNRLYLEETP